MDRKLRSLWRRECHLEVRNICCNNVFSPISVHYFISKAHTLVFRISLHPDLLLSVQVLVEPVSTSSESMLSYNITSLPLTGTWENWCHAWSPRIPPHMTCKDMLCHCLPRYKVHPPTASPFRARLQIWHCTRHDAVMGVLENICRWKSASGLNVSSAFRRQVRVLYSGLSDGSAAQGEGAACPQAPLLGLTTL